DSVAPLIELDGLAENRWIGCVARAPEAIADDRDLIVAILHFFGSEKAAKRGRDAEHRQQIGGSAHASNGFRPVALGDIEAGAAEIGDILEYAGFRNVV